jgi:aminoglycoside phosphotransferase (APT) family kinase protein
MYSNIELESIFKNFIVDEDIIEIAAIKGGHINETYKVVTKVSSYVLQSVNTSIFKNIDAIENNINLQNIALQNTDYQLLTPIFYKSIHGRIHEKINEKTWRLMSFIPDSKVVEKLTPESVLEAASSYSAYLSVLNKGNALAYSVSIPDFKNPQKYFDEYIFAYTNCDEELLRYLPDLSLIMDGKDRYCSRYQNLLTKLPFRIAHNDAKLTNILFDIEEKKAISVIDLDTLQPGLIIDDFGDMVRSMATYFDENENDFDKVIIDDLLLKAVIQGYLKHLKKVLLPIEKENIFFIVELTIFVQGVRFLIDFMNGNKYYHVSYPLQNHDRAKNQFALFGSFISKKAVFFKALKQALK